MVESYLNPTYRIAGNALELNEYGEAGDIVLASASRNAGFVYFNPGLWTDSEQSSVDASKDDFPPEQDPWPDFGDEDKEEEENPDENPDEPGGMEPPVEEEPEETEEEKQQRELAARRREAAYKFLGYADDGVTYRSFPLEAYNTRLSTPNEYDADGNILVEGEDGLGNYYIYVRIDVSAQRALLVFSMYEKDELVYENDDDEVPQYAWVLVGKYWSDDAIGRRQLYIDYGCLDTPRETSVDKDGDWYVTDSKKQLVDFRTYEDDSSWSFNKFCARLYRFVNKTIPEKLVDIFSVRTSEDTTRESDDRTLPTTRWATRRFLRKDMDDEMKYNLKLSGNKVVLGKSPLNLGTSGNGFQWVKEGDTGYGVLQVESLKVLRKMEVSECSIQEVNYIGGSIVLTPANGFTVTAVEWLEYKDYAARTVQVTDDETHRIGFRLHFETKENGLQIVNSWRQDDLAYCSRWDVRTGTSSGFSTHFWWRRVMSNPLSTSDYIDVYDFMGQDGFGKGYMHSLSDVPAVGDKVVMLGNVSDAERQSAIIMSASESGAPFFRMYKGIDTFSLNNAECFVDLSQEKAAIMASYVMLGGREGEQDKATSLQEWYEKSRDIISDVSKQLDKSFMIHQSDNDVVPSLDNEPASGWSAEEYAEHVGDFYISRSGLVWKFADTGSGYAWEPIDDVYLTAFVKKLDAKSTTFMTSDGELPTGYKVHDLWMNATGSFMRSDGTAVSYDHEMLICVSRIDGEPESIDDWMLANNYQSSISMYLDEMKQIAAKYGIPTDGKIETYFVASYSELDSMASSWSAAGEKSQLEHLGDLGFVTGDGKLYEYTRDRDDDDLPYTYRWAESADAITRKVIEMASQAKAAADGKVTTFLFEKGSFPSGYEVGDMWYPVTGKFSVGEKTFAYDNDLLVCISTANGNILDWSRIGVTKQWVLDQGFLSEKGFAQLFAKAVSGSEETKAEIGALVQYDEKLKKYVSVVDVSADHIIFEGAAQFVKRVQSALDYDRMTSQLNNAVPRDEVLAALNESATTIEGGLISTKLIDVDNLYVKHLKGADGTFSGFIQTTFQNAADKGVEQDNFTGSVCRLSGDHCHLVVKNAYTYVLPSSLDHEGKRIVLLNTSSAVGAVGFSTVKVDDGSEFLGYQGADTENAIKKDVTEIRFRGGIMEFLAIPAKDSCQWVCTVNRTAFSEANYAAGYNIGSSPRLLFYGFVQYIDSKVKLTVRNSALLNDPVITRQSTGVYGVDLSYALQASIQLYECFITVTGLGGDSSNRPYVASIGTYKDAERYFDVRTTTYGGTANGGFILKIEH